jgi:hypothetical protein
VGTGISELEIETAQIDADQFPKTLMDRLQSTRDERETVHIQGFGYAFQIDAQDPGKVVRKSLQSLHRVHGRDYGIPFHEESDGTQRCLDLLPALYHLANEPKVFVVDELDRSLHPLLCHALLKLFLEACPGHPRQMIVTTHETHLLDLDLLRRDEIWFMEKDRRQQSQLASLVDFNTRKDLRIEKGYLQGRFGGIPFIGNTKKLMDLIQCPAHGTRHATKTPS